MNAISTRIVAACGLVIFLSGSASAATLYVNNSGSPACSDATAKASNTAASPWCTIGRAAWGSTNRSAPNASEAAQASDIVEVRAGTYNFSGTIGNRWSVVYNPVNQGTSSAPITFQAIGTVRLTAPTTASPVIGCSTRSFVRWRGPFDLDEANIRITPDTGTVVMHAATGCVVDGVSIDGNGAPTYVDNHTGIRIENCNSCVARNNTIHDVLHYNSNLNGAGVQLYNSNDTIVENNYVYNSGSGVAVKGIFGANSQLRTIVRHNLLVGNLIGMYLAGTRDARVYQNVVRDGGNGVQLTAQSPETDDHPINDIVANNTFHSMSQACVLIISNAHQNVRIWNNICSNSTSRVFTIGNNPMPVEGAIDVEHQIYDGYGGFAQDSTGLKSFDQWKASYGHDSANPASIQSDPLFVNESANDFRLCTGAGAPASSCTGASPAMTRGVDLLDLDNDGNTTEVIRAGAFVTNGETIGPSTQAPASTLSAPTNLRITP